MAKQTVNIGTAPNDGTGDPLRTAFDKCNDNFDELYSPVYINFNGGNFRMGERSGALRIDQTITPAGFGGAEDTDWENIAEFKIPV